MYIWKLVDSDGEIVKYDGIWCSGYTNTDEGNVVFGVPKNEGDDLVVYTLIMYDEDDPSCSGKSTVTVPACESSECSCSVTDNYPGGVTDTGYIPQGGKINPTLATIESDCSNLSLSGTCDWINGVQLAASPDYKMLIGFNASENPCSTNRKATFNIMKSETEICGTVNVFQKGEGIQDVTSKYTGENPPEPYQPTNSYVSPNGGETIIGTFKAKKTCTLTNDDVTIAPHCDGYRSWFRIVGISSAGFEGDYQIYNVIVDVYKMTDETNYRQCEFGIIDNNGGYIYSSKILMIQARI